MSLPDKFMVCLGRTLSGHHHDYTMLKQELPPELDWFTDLHVRVDLDYLGIKSDYRGEQIDIPTKKPRKSHKNPNPQLSEEHKAANTALRRVRIFIEHAIGGMKRSNILVHTFRNRIENFGSWLKRLRRLGLELRVSLWRPTQDQTNPATTSFTPARIEADWIVLGKNPSCC